MNGKNKGGNFERNLCKLLSRWWTRGERDDVFWRTSNSGGRATFQNRRAKKTRVHCGDIAAIDPIGEPLLDLVTIEAKKGYNKRTIHDLLDKPERAKLQQYEEWFQQAEEERLNRGCPFWWVIHARDCRQALIFFPDTLAKFLILPPFSNQIILYWNQMKIVGCRLVDFLATIEPEDFRGC